MRSDIVEVVVGLEKQASTCVLETEKKAHIQNLVFKKTLNEPHLEKRIERLTSCSISSSFGITQSSRKSPLFGNKKRFKTGTIH